MSSSVQFSVLVFLRHLSAPVVLYTDNPTQLYEELRQLMLAVKPAQARLIEKPGVGPLKKVSFWDSDMMGCAIQADLNMATASHAPQAAYAPPPGYGPKGLP